MLKTKFNKIFSTQILWLCIVTDLTFIILNVVYELSNAIADPALKISEDRGYAEVFQYVKEFWIVEVLVLLAFRSHSLLYLAWSGFFSYLLLDDSLRIHETWSKILPFPNLFGLNRHASGELIISLTAGFIFLFLIAVAYRSGDAFAKRTLDILL
ncbi:MAG: hypothetical protein F6J97_09590, partial [Leptolyngbya sp. SIO4C1]|nr:hypothetical protein [Leptolyngbya sp. SIO4C1]